MHSGNGMCQVVVGAQWGDEGKGKIVDVLAEEADLVARFQGGANAGHTIVIDGRTFVLHQVPSGILHGEKQCLIGNGVVLEPVAFFEEIDALEAEGVSTGGRIHVSDRAHLILPYHKALDAASERRRGEGAIGTTGRGIGPAYADKAARSGLRVSQIDDLDAARAVVEASLDAKRGRPDDEALDVDAVLDGIESWADRLLGLAVDGSLLVSRTLSAGGRVLLEGAQGSLLDIDHGTYPFVTSSSTTAAGAAIGVGIGPRAIDSVVGVVKAYTTRVGNGPLPTEVDEPVQSALRESGGEYGATTGRPRRCGWFDAVVARYAARVNGFTELAVTKIDVLDEFETIRVCTAYRTPEETLDIDAFPADLQLLRRCEPVYEEVAGWRSSITAARGWDELPDAARRYVERIETLVGVPVTRVSVGQGRSQILER